MEQNFNNVLIGPCGIEIYLEVSNMRIIYSVLIGPCGIEIAMCENATAETQVLIGPCGIEIMERKVLKRYSFLCINWTLRN